MLDKENKMKLANTSPTKDGKCSPVEAAMKLRDQFFVPGTPTIKNPYKEQVNEILRELDVALSDTLSE